MRKNHRLTDKRYARDNRLITPKSSYWRSCLAPRCRLFTSWSWSWFQGFGCSPIKVERELGLERRKTVWSLSTMRVKKLKEVYFSTRGSNKVNLWWTGYYFNSMPGSYVYTKKLLKASKQEIYLNINFFLIVIEYYINRICVLKRQRFC